MYITGAANSWSLVPVGWRLPVTKSSICFSSQPCVHFSCLEISSLCHSAGEPFRAFKGTNSLFGPHAEGPPPLICHMELSIIFLFWSRDLYPCLTLITLCFSVDVLLYLLLLLGHQPPMYRDFDAGTQAASKQFLKITRQDKTRACWCTAVIPSLLEAEAEGLQFWAQPGQLRDNLPQKKK